MNVRETGLPIPTRWSVQSYRRWVERYKPRQLSERATART
jgi:hypothetical protein